MPELKPRAPSGLAVVHALRTALSRMKTHEQAAKGGDPEGVHRLRSASRRLRSELDALQEMVDLQWREKVQGELKWLARLLGDARDLDILLARLREGAKQVEPKEVDCNALATLLANVEARRAAAGRRVVESLESDRYRAALAMLERGASRPPLAEAAALPCKAVLPPAAKSAWRRLKKSARDLQSDAPAAEFHEVRKCAKRCRYTAELIAPALGHRALRPSSDFIRLTSRVQDSLGEHQDALITARELVTSLAEYASDPDLVRTASALLEDQQKRARAARVHFFKVWTKLDHKKLRRWMRPRGDCEPAQAERPFAIRTNGYHV
jgi:CHAD domain-containing protein